MPGIQKVVIVSQDFFERIRHAYRRGREGIGSMMVHVQFRILGKGEVCGCVELSLTSLLLIHTAAAATATAALVVTSTRIELIGSLYYCVAVMLLRFVGRCDNGR